MAIYESFAQVYDLFMDNVPYDEWAGRICAILREDGIEDGLVLDLGCGTGQMTRRLLKAGYDMIGVDASAEMLDMARQEGILYLQQDMRAFELYGTVRAVVSVCDSLNYITDPEELLTVFRLVNNYLDPGGLFIFDMNTVYDYEEICAENTFSDVRDEGAFIWENDYDPEAKLNTYDLTLFIRETDGLYRRFAETHEERAYSLEEVRTLLAKAGMDFIAAFDGYSDRPLTETSERMVILSRERGK